MDQIEGTSNASTLTLEPEDDLISTMPENVITHILDRVPILYAIRTSALSRQWRFKWTMLSQLEFDEDFNLYLLRKGIEKDFGAIVTQILFHHIGDITKFSVTLSINVAAEYINDWVMLLSRNRIKDLSFRNSGRLCKFPTHLFACLELEHLELKQCSVSPAPSTFHGFPNLLSLRLDSVVFESCTYEILFSRCSLLEMLALSSRNIDDVKVLEIAKLQNLRVLRLRLLNLDYRAIITSFDVLQRMSLLSKLHELNLDLLNCRVFVKEKERFKTLLPCLKALLLNDMDFSCANLLSLVYALIYASRNARTLKITVGPVVINDEAEDANDIDEVDDVGDAYDMADTDRHKMGPLQLREVTIDHVTCSENEVLLLKSLLSSSPYLKKMKIVALTSRLRGEIIKLFKKLLNHRASPLVEVRIFYKREVVILGGGT
ncbi:putative F-box/LRR-repeat protein At3g58880 [Rutidosis leptorrhynchoides]|uniref:putative F-box/LRR-repeat protein At3g58880 n=1 Tax=Rutidosis leptorrhynchoides TaxID=125765 RepID=UPI003A994B46